jgi:hypothetical protein
MKRHRHPFPKCPSTPKLHLDGFPNTPREKIPTPAYLSFRIVTAKQGDQFGRFFASWVIIYLGLFKKNTSTPYLCAIYFNGKSINFDQK